MRIRYIEAFFLTENTNELNIVTDDNIVPYKVYWTYNNDKHTDDKHFIFESDQKNTEFTFEYDTKRLQYFIIEFENGQSYLFGYRILPMAGMYNFRDIGGYITKDNMRIKWGKVYRSDYLANLDEKEGMEYLQSVGLKTIIDFRSPEEVAEKPNRHVSDDIKEYNFDPNAHIARLAGSLQTGSEIDNDEIIARAKETEAAGMHKGDEEMIGQQINFVKTSEAQEAFRNTLLTIVDEQASPNMQHCRGGKDRTGFALMLLEGLLGVEEKELIYDYFLTNRAREKKNKEYYERFLEKTGDEKIAAYMFSLFNTKEKYIEAAINEIVENYGGFENYVMNTLKISATDIEKLRHNFLEEA